MIRFQSWFLEKYYEPHWYQTNIISGLYEVYIPYFLLDGSYSRG